MFAFTGDYRKKPQQALRGTRVAEQREESLQKAAEARRQREELRRKIQSVVRIQALARKFLLRAERRRALVTDVERNKQSLSTSGDFSHLLQYVRAANLYLVSHVTTEEVPVLFVLTQLLVKAQQRLVEECSRDKATALSVARFLGKALQLASSPADINSVLRLAEILIGHDQLPANTQTIICSCLLDRGFFHSCLRVLQARSVGLSLTPSHKAPTEFHAAVFSLLLRPLVILLPLNGKMVVVKFTQEVLSHSKEAIVSEFVLRALADLKASAFPVVVLINQAAEAIRQEQLPAADVWQCWSWCLLTNGWATSLHGATVLTVMNHALMGLIKPQSFILADDEKRRKIEEDESEDEEMEDVRMKERHVQKVPSKEEEKEAQVRKDILASIEAPAFITMVLSALEVKSSQVVEEAAGMCTSLITSQGKEAISMPTLFYKMAFHMPFLKALWQRICEFDVVERFRTSHNITFSFAGSKSWIRLYTVFARLLVCTMATVYDDEFAEHSGQEKAHKTGGFEFKLEEVVDIAASSRDVAAGLVFVAYSPAVSTESDYSYLMTHLFSSVVNLIRELHDRDARRSFCPEGFWISNKLTALADKARRSGNPQFIYDVFETCNPFRPLKNGLFAGASVDEVRFNLVLDQVPCLLPFNHRLLFVYLTLRSDKSASRREADFLRADSFIHVKVRREYIYEDAFTDLHPNVVSDMKKPLKVAFQNLAGLDEAGVDGGGLFREFMNQSLRSGFDPNRGFFRSNEEAALYPNPEATILFPTSYKEHFFFLGRMLGKAVYENLLTELHFADFFLKKLLSKHNVGNVDIHYLKSLDPTLFKNLLYLKQYAGDVSELQLDFSVTVDEMGVTRQVDLKPNGKNIPVTKDNVVEYIFLMADFKLNRQIRVHTACFREGLNDVVPIQLLQIFNFKELQTLISGTEEPIDVKDWRKHTSYGNPYDEEHPTITAFWNVIQSFSEPTKRKLLKFVTSCSRPPLLGFKELPHKFTINPATGEDRLPTASTCMNLLKLPVIKDEQKLREKLLYAIESESGFELS